MSDKTDYKLEEAKKALRLAKKALSIHGPCKNNSCSECAGAWIAIGKALLL